MVSLIFNIFLHLEITNNENGIKFFLSNYGIEINTNNRLTGAQFEGDLGKILTLGAEILPYIVPREKWESP